jgi:putative PIN family toxin of toxin-antitoxin system
VALLDTNVLASGFVRSSGIPGQLLWAWRDREFELVTSDQVLEELERTLGDRYFKARLTRRQRKRALSLVRRRAVRAEITSPVRGVAPSEADDLVLGAAISAGAHYVVTGDRDFLAVGSHGGTRLTSPRQFRDILRAEARR